MERFKEIEIAPFGAFVRVVMGETIPKILAYMEENFEPGPGIKAEEFQHANGAVLRIDVDGLFFWAILFEDGTSDEVIVHEVFHLVMKLADTKGCIWSNESDEWYAYCIKDTYKKVKDAINE
jgi:hypothetical protein